MTARVEKQPFIDADIHVLEQLDMWERLPRAFRERVDIQLIADDPYYRDKLFDVYLDGHPIPTWKGDRKERLNKIIPRLKEKLKPGAGFDPAQCLRDFDVEGLDAAAIYPTWCLMAPWIPALGSAFAGAIARAYNDWIHDFCSIDRRRMRPVAVISLTDIDEAIREVERNAARNFVGVFVRPNPIYGRTLGHPDYTRLYEVLEKLEMPLGIHEGTHSYLPTAGLDRTTTQGGHHIVSHPFEQMLAFLSLYEARVFEKFPKMNTLFLECGTLWAPYWIERVQAEQGEYRVSGKMEPATEVFARQCFVTTEVDDHFLPTVVQLLGEESVMLSSDYPHDESRYPHSKRLFLEQKISEEVRRKVGHDNALRAYPRFESY